LSSPTVSTKLARIAEQSKRDAAQVFTTLAHLMDEDFLTEAFHQLRKDAAAGIDQMTADEYEVGLAGRIADLHWRLVAREYRAQPARRVWIPKLLALLLIISRRPPAVQNRFLGILMKALPESCRRFWIKVSLREPCA
jgi:hypothetical protein